MTHFLTPEGKKQLEEKLSYYKSVKRVEAAQRIAVAREFGDLSENAEYKEAKREKRKNESRIRYLENMIRTARVIEIEGDADTVSLFDRVKIFNEKAGKEREIQIVTTLRQNALEGYISKESPLGSALMGHKNGDRILVEVSPTMSYYVKILEITKGTDNEDLPISGY